MAVSQADLDALDEAIAMGAKRVKYSDKEVEYNSLADMFRARKFLLKKLGQAGTRPSRIYPSTSKGLGTE